MTEKELEELQAHAYAMGFRAAVMSADCVFDEGGDLKATMHQLERELANLEQAEHKNIEPGDLCMLEGIVLDRNGDHVTLPPGSIVLVTYIDDDDQWRSHGHRKCIVAYAGQQLHVPWLHLTPTR